MHTHTLILLLIRLMPVSLCLQPQHSLTLQYIPLCLHFAADKAYACVPMPSAIAFPYTAVHTPNACVPMPSAVALPTLQYIPLCLHFAVEQHLHIASTPCRSNHSMTKVTYTSISNSFSRMSSRSLPKLEKWCSSRFVCHLRIR